MTALSERAEQIAAHLVGHETGSIVEPNGRQGVIDFNLTWPDGRVGGLEVTLVTEPESSAWQGMAMRDGWRWPAPSGWEFRLNAVSFPYKKTRSIVLRAVELCDVWAVDRPSDLPEHVIADDPELAGILTNRVGELSRTPFAPGVVLYQTSTAEFVDAVPPDFCNVIETWLALPHIVPHINKVRSAAELRERHLFIIPTSETLPIRFFTDDFDAPARVPEGFDGLDGLWIWSDYWHRYLALRDARWTWVEFPPVDSTKTTASAS